MDFLLGILLAVLGILAVLLTRSFTTLIHEYGHAIPALLFTDGEVTVHVGSYGNIDNALVFRLGRLTTYFKFNMLHWNIGLCRHAKAANIWQSFLIVLGGPIASVLVSIPLIFLFQQEGLPEVWRFLIPVFALSALFDFFVNIIPMSSPMRLHDGGIAYNDGYQLRELLRAATKPTAYLNGLNLMAEKKYAAAFAEFERLTDEGIHDRAVYEKMVDCLMKQKKYREARAFYENILQRFPLKTQDYSILGELNLRLKNYDTALDNLNIALHHNFQNAMDLNHRGRVFIELRNYREAAFDLNNAIRIQPHFADAYANRGLLHIKNKELKAAEWDLNQALALDENHASAHLYLGYFYEQSNEPNAEKLALSAFQKAQALGVEETNMEWILAEAERKINFS